MKITNPVHQWQLSFEGEWPTSVVFLGNNRLAAGNRGGEIFLWDLPENSEENDPEKPADHAPVRRLDGHTNGITHLLVTPDKKTLISASLDHTICYWDVEAPAQETVEVILDQKNREQSTRYKSKEEKEKILAAPGVKVETIASKHLLEQHEGWINGLGMSADGARLISGDDRCKTVVWDLKTRKPISSWYGYDRVWVRSCALTPDGKTAFTCEYAGRRSNFDAPAAQVRFWNAETGEMALDLLKIWTPKIKDENRNDTYQYWTQWKKLLHRGLVCAEFSPDGKMLAVGQGGETDTGKVLLVDVASGKILRTVSGHRYGVCDVTFSANNQYVLSSGRDTTVRICQVSDGKEVAVLGKSRGGQFKDWLHAIAVSPDQKSVAAADIAGKVHVWQLAPQG